MGSTPDAGRCRRDRATEIQLMSTGSTDRPPSQRSGSRERHVPDRPWPPYTFDVFTEELSFHLGLALTALLDLESLADEVTATAEEGVWHVTGDSGYRIYNCVIAMVTAVAAVSRLLWPVADPTGIATKLRRHIRVGGILRDRSIRDAIAHMDETFHGNLAIGEDPATWMITWREVGEGGLWAGTIDTSDDPPALRRFDVTTFDLDVRRGRWSERVNVREVRIGIDALLGELHREREINEERGVREI
jgi:hypothetical protein